LQRSDGSIPFAFNTLSGDCLPQYRTGVVAQVGLAAAYYRERTGSHRYDALLAGSLKWLLTQRQLDATRPGYGLLVCGPAVTSTSTQHTLYALAFLVHFIGAV